MERHDGTATRGRKGIAYDWEDLLVQAAVERIDQELATILSAPTQMAMGE